MWTLVIKKILNKITNPTVLLLVLLILSNSIWFFRYHLFTSSLYKEISSCKSNLKQIEHSNNECINNITTLEESYKQELSLTKSIYEKQLEECRNSKVKIKKVIEYKTKEVPVEKIKIVKELQKCDIQVIEVNNNENNQEDIVKHYLDHIGY